MPSLLIGKRLRLLGEREALEPVISWGFRMGLVSMIPLLYGNIANEHRSAEWVSLAAICMCWVELKGTVFFRIRLILAGTVLALASGLLGSIAGSSLIGGTAMMVMIAFISVMFRNLGDRGAGLAICVFLLFIFGSAHPAENGAALLQRTQYILAGAGLNTLIALVAGLFMPLQQPFRRSIARIVKAVSSLCAVAAEGYADDKARGGVRKVYLKEKEIRLALDQSLALHEVGFQEREALILTKEGRLAQVRKATALTSAQLLDIHEELQAFSIRSLSNPLRLRIAEIFTSTQKVLDTLATYILTLKPEDGLLVRNRLRRLNNVISILRDFDDEMSPEIKAMKERLCILAGRISKLNERSLGLLEQLTDTTAFRSYPIIKTLLVLHPKYWYSNVQLLFRFNSQTLRYAIRTALIAGFAYFIYKYFGITRGYWLPLTVLIVAQPWFGATWKKAIDRSLGTIIGGTLGSVLFLFPAGLYLKEFMLFASALLMVYFMRKNYALAALFITLNIVLIFSVSESLSVEVLLVRLSCTLGGALLAVGSGFVLLPNWDRESLPRDIDEMLRKNAAYFQEIVKGKSTSQDWLRYKKAAEGANSNAFDAFNRYINEPGNPHEYSLYYQLIMHNIRTTRLLNNVQLEFTGQQTEEGNDQKLKIDNQILQESAILFDKIEHQFPIKKTEQSTAENIKERELSAYQKLHLDKLKTELLGILSNLEELEKKQSSLWRKM